MKYIHFKIGPVRVQVSYGDAKDEPVKATRIIGTIPASNLPRIGSLDDDIRDIKLWAERRFVTK